MNYGILRRKWSTRSPIKIPSLTKTIRKVGAKIWGAMIGVFSIVYKEYE